MYIVKSRKIVMLEILPREYGIMLKNIIFPKYWMVREIARTHNIEMKDDEISRKHMNEYERISVRNKMKKQEKWKFRITHFWRLADIRDSFDFNIAKLCAPSNNCEQKRYFGTMKFRDNVFIGALYAYRFFPFLVSPRILRVRFESSRASMTSKVI